MNVHVTDSEMYKDLYGNEKIRQCFSDEDLLRQWIAIEVALAQAQAELGIIPYEAFEEIKRKGKIENFDMERIRKGITDTSHPLISFIRMFEELCDENYGEYVHYGATTQDIMDTGLILQLKNGYEYITQQMNDTMNVLFKRIKETRDVPMAGRTHGQHALPITLGFKLATWLAEFQRHALRLEQLRCRVFVGQLGGAVGTLASLEQEDGLKVQKRVMEILRLENPSITWHSSRDNLVELASVYAMISGTIGKIANEIINLQRTEIGEIEEGFESGKVGSSTMPHKRNPMNCEYIVGLSRLVRLQMSTVYDTLVQEHERDMGLWLVEWELWPEISIYTSKLLSDITMVVKNMIVNEANIKNNLHLTNGFIVSERMMFKLSPFVGKQTAHDIVYEICMEAYDNNERVIDAFLRDEIVRKHMSEVQIKETLNPENYLGFSKQYVDNVLRNYEEWVNK